MMLPPYFYLLIIYYYIIFNSLLIISIIFAFASNKICLIVRECFCELSPVYHRIKGIY